MAKYKVKKSGCPECVMAKGCPVGNMVLSMKGTSKKILENFK